MAEIKCPMCGKPNPAELDVCQFCQARLKPLTGELGRSQPPIRPGEEPTDKDTGQLEHTLPRWLREIRQQARESDKEETGQPAAGSQPGQQDQNADLLAGLRSEAKGEEELPDWLAGLRGESGQVGFEEETTGAEKPNELPTWASDWGNEGKEQSDKVEGGQQADSDFRWDADFGSESGLQAGSTKEEGLFDSELPAWLRETNEPQGDESASQLPDWLGAQEPAQTEGESEPLIEENELPGWLQRKEEPPPERADTDLPDWLASLGEEESEVPTSGEAQPAESAIKSTTDWLASLHDEAPETDQPVSESEPPDWVSSLGEESHEQVTPQESGEPAGAGDLPAWLAALGEESNQSSDEIAEPSPAPSGDEIPGWLASTGEVGAETGQPVEELDQLAFESGVPAGETGTTPAFVDDEGKPISTEDVDAIFSMDMPDWLAEAGGAPESGPTQPAVEPFGEDELRPAELPTWVEALRPVESVISESEAGSSGEQPVEERGPLAGLRGVLPAMPGVGPSSKPRGYSFKLQVSEDQQASAALLEKILSEEVTPEPVVTRRVVLSHRILRWLIAAVLLIIVSATVFYGAQINPVPTGVPPETSDAWNYVKDSLPANAPVLLVFDYHAARAGEMEATAAPLIDQMLTLKAPRLSMVASTPTGSGLAERFMGILQRDRSFARDENFTNLGYLPGGAAGVLAFAQNPVTTKQLTTTGEDAWTTPALAGVRKLSDFAAIILLTDDLETARIWIEQTEGLRRQSGFLVVSSAQSGPLILPYVRSGQVDGMVSGLEGGAPIEQANSGRPGMARGYWDAFGFGLLAAVVMITIGSVWSLISTLQSTRKEQGEA